MNSTKVQGHGLSVKFLGVIWSGKTKVIPEAVIDEVWAFPTPTNVALLQEFLGLLGYWRVFIPHLAQVLKPLYQLVRKSVRWDWDEMCICLYYSKTGSQSPAGLECDRLIKAL